MKNYIATFRARRAEYKFTFQKEFTAKSNKEALLIAKRILEGREGPEFTDIWFSYHLAALYQVRKDGRTKSIPLPPRYVVCLQWSHLKGRVTEEEFEAMNDKEAKNKMRELLQKYNGMGFDPKAELYRIDHLDKTIKVE